MLLLPLALTAALGAPQPSARVRPTRDTLPNVVPAPPAPAPDAGRGAPECRALPAGPGAMPQVRPDTAAFRMPRLRPDLAPYRMPGAGRAPAGPQSCPAPPPR